MNAVLILYAIAAIDGLFVGYRDAMGRNPRLDKQNYYLRAMGYGIGLAHLAMVLIAVTVLASLAASAEPAALVTSLERVATTMHTIYLGYAGCVALTFCAYALPSYDLRSYITVSAFGLLTLVRPLVIVAGALIAALHADTIGTWPVCAVVALAMGSLQLVMRRLDWNRFDWAPYRAGGD